MATLTLDLPRPWVLGDYEQHPVIANDIIFEGAAVGDNGSGYARPLVAGDQFLGFAEINVDNTGGSAGDKGVRVKREGAAQLPVTSLAITDVGKDVYASDDNTFLLTATSNSYIGTVRSFISPVALRRLQWLMSAQHTIKPKSTPILQHWLQKLIIC
jgi:predicted RecA/RadA family phage recombinase